jgi:predicted RNA-binding Zn ribbon-like protein
VQRFLNTLDHELDTDAFTDARSAASWMRSEGFRTEVGPKQLAMLRSLREALRTVIAEADSQRLNAKHRSILTAASARARIGATTLSDGSVRLVPAATGIPGFLSALFLAMHDSETDGTWSRLQICQRCRWAFFDITKNTSASWCTVRCSQRAKAARHYRRKIGQRPNDQSRP